MMTEEEKEIFGTLIDYGLINFDNGMVSLTDVGVKFGDLQEKGHIKVIDGAISTNTTATAILKKVECTDLKQVVELLHKKLIAN